MARWRISSILLATTVGLAQAGCSQGVDPVQPPGPNAATAAAGGDTGTGPAKRPGQAPAHWWLKAEVTTKLGLTDDQLQQIKQVMSGRSEEGLERAKRERRASTQLLRALNQNPYDPALVERLSAELDQVLAYNHRHRIEQVRALRDILTHQQWMMMWDVAPQALQMGRIQIVMGPRITVTDGTPVPTGDSADEVDGEEAPETP